MPRLKHFNFCGTTNAVNFSCYRRLQLLRNREDFISVLQAIDQVRRKHEFLLISYVLMPNHAHLVIYPQIDSKVGQIIGEIKAISGKEILSRWKARGFRRLSQLRVMRNGKPRFVFWQRRCFDFNCRTEEDVWEKVSYCHNNPVKAGLVTAPDEWPWSSITCYGNNPKAFLSIDKLPE